MKRRTFITHVGSAAAACSFSGPLAARAQQRTLRIGVLLAIAENDPQAPLRAAALQKGLQETGWVVGRNLQIDYRFGGGDRARLRAFAAELAGLTPDVIVVGGTGTLQAAMPEIRTIPIVMVQVADPVVNGFVKSLERPGGNITGFAQFEFAASSKWVQLLKEVSPNMRRLLVLHDVTTATKGYIPAIEASAGTFGLALTLSGVRDGDEIDRALDEFARHSHGGLSLLSGPLTVAHRDRVIAAAARHRLPAVYPLRFYAESGGLMSYSANSVDMYRQSASYVDRILRGAKPADLPVQQPVKLELIINLKTAKTLGLAMPPTLLATADEVIE
jgi:putative ABC transport system substrate-binding protein